MVRAFLVLGWSYVPLIGFIIYKCKHLIICVCSNRQSCRGVTVPRQDALRLLLHLRAVSNEFCLTAEITSAVTSEINATPYVAVSDIS